jgi:hypothetical protein
VVLEQALKRRWRHLAEERIEDVKPVIPLGKRFWALSKRERRPIDDLFAGEQVRELILGSNSAMRGTRLRLSTPPTG